MPMIINTTDTLGYSIWGLNSITGSWYITLLIIFVLIIAFALVLRIPLEFTAILVLPLTITFAVASGNFVSVLIVILMYLGVILGRNFFFGN